jgi:hypothetical protein
MIKKVIIWYKYQTPLIQNTTFGIKNTKTLTKLYICQSNSTTKHHFSSGILGKWAKRGRV